VGGRSLYLFEVRIRKEKTSEKKKATLSSGGLCKEKVSSKSVGTVATRLCLKKGEETL